MPHIHNNQGDHDHTISAFIVRLDSVEPRVLVHTHKKYPMLLQPGGHVEIQENIWQAACHEIEEETGYELEQLRILQPKVRLKFLTESVIHPIPININTHQVYRLDTDVVDHYHSDVVYGFVTDELPTNKPGKGESQDLRWLTIEELRATPVDELGGNAREIGIAMIEMFLPEYEQVPTTDFVR
jgi:8-oxo-dGTP pyrophosphatase MutT (NUDIX family)